MLLASTMANIACGNAKLALAHAFTQVLTSYGVPHGLGLGVVLPHVMAFNLPACPGKLAAIARALGEPDDGRDDQALAQAGIERVKTLLRRLGYPVRLSSVDVPPELPRLALLTSKRTQARFNIRPSSLEELQELWRQAYAGWDQADGSDAAWQRFMGPPPAVREPQHSVAAAPH
jgi:alcohol dehydrogenase class IV